MALAFVASVAAARALGPRAYGGVVLAIAMASLIARFLDLTLDEAVVHHGARALAAGDIGRLRGFLRTALIVDLAMGVAVSGLMIIFAGPIAGLLSDGRLDPMLLRLAALTTLVATVDGTTGAVLFLARRPDLRAWSVAASSLARLVFVIVALQIGGSRVVLLAFVLGSAVGSALQGVIAWRTGWRTWAQVPRSRQPAGVMTLLKFGLHTSLATSAVAANRQIVKIMLGRTAGLRAVGILDAGMLPLDVVNLVSNPLRLWFFPEQARLWAEGKRDKLRRLVRTFSLGGLAVGIPGAVAGWFILPHLIPAAYSERFADAVVPARIMLVTAVIWLATAWRKNLAGAVGRPQMRTVMAILELVILGALAAFLLEHGANGGAAALAITSVIVGFAWILLVGRLLPKDDSAPPGRQRDR